MTLLAIAPGAQATTMKPSASAGGRPLSVAAAKPSEGMTRYCVATPRPMARGRVSVSRSSSGCSTTPSANMVTANSP